MDVSGVPIPKANIEFGCETEGQKNILFKTVTGIDGYFSIRRLIAGACFAKVTVPGFRPFETKISVPESRVLEFGTIRLEVGSCIQCIEVRQL